MLGWIDLVIDTLVWLAKVADVVLAGASLVRRWLDKIG